MAEPPFRATNLFPASSNVDGYPFQYDNITNVTPSAGTLGIVDVSSEDSPVTATVQPGVARVASTSESTINWKQRAWVLQDTEPADPRGFTYITGNKSISINVSVSHSNLVANPATLRFQSSLWAVSNSDHTSATRIYRMSSTAIQNAGTSLGGSSTLTGSLTPVNGVGYFFRGFRLALQMMFTFSAPSPVLGANTSSFTFNRGSNSFFNAGLRILYLEDGTSQGFGIVDGRKIPILVGEANGIGEVSAQRLLEGRRFFSVPAIGDSAARATVGVRDEPTGVGTTVQRATSFRSSLVQGEGLTDPTILSRRMAEATGRGDASAVRHILLVRRIATQVATGYANGTRTVTFVRKDEPTGVLHTDDEDRNQFRLRLPVGAIPSSDTVIIEDKPSPEIILVDGKPALKISNPDIYTEV